MYIDVDHKYIETIRNKIMDQDLCREMEERLSIRDTSRKLKKYGSTSKHLIRNENLVKHFVCKSDTLAGIALKYGVTTEQIRRVNRLWASDSLFLREYLLVPVPKDSNTQQFNEGIVRENSRGDCDVPSATHVASTSSDDSSVDNFLAKMDSSIASVKREIQKVQGQSSFMSDDEMFVQRRPGTRSLRHSLTHSTPPITSTGSSMNHHMRSSSEDDVHDLPSAVVMTHGKKLKTSLQKLQQQQDEIFQL
ncbi:lysM and putative peptidoglycan-binding domain-containing protein 2 [Diachasma alloeum]|uniref:lysM and putative peptidoglycan-binding domain-containing protein 2 n=1 Tax=Diachasma alloeum TaxID=454923 RepID=UPI0007383611|nr:lysM and putative peptidoglycan-binding domain-containing protein 2 [Diachasma alloeum]